MLCLFFNSSTAPITATFPQTQIAYAESDEVVGAVGEVVAGTAYVLDEERFRLFKPPKGDAFAPGKWVACRVG